MWNKSWLEQFPIISFDQKEKIISAGESVAYNYYLINGICAKIFPTYEGRDLILQYYRPGKMLGLHLHQLGSTSSLDFVAKTSCRCYKIPCDLIESQLKQDNALCYAMMQEAVDECNFWADNSIAHILGGGISVLTLALESLAIPQKDGTFLIDSLFTNIELSNFCGIHAVSISRFITKLTKEGILERKKEGIIIYDMPRLTSYINLGE